MERYFPLLRSAGWVRRVLLPRAGNDSFDHSGRAWAGKDVVYVFSKPASGWVDGVETARLSGILQSNEYLISVAVNPAGTAILAGSLMAVSENSGSAYLYLEPKKGWTTTSTFNAKFNASDQARRDGFGSSVAVSNSTAVVGSPFAAIQGSPELGAAYLFGHQ